MKTAVFTVTLATVSTTAVAAAQTLGGAGNFTLVGGSWASPSLCSRAGILVGHTISLTSTGDISGANITITGSSSDGATISETIVGPHNSTVTTTNRFATVTQIASDSAIATNTSAGFANVAQTQLIHSSRFAFTTSIGVVPTGTINYTVQECWQDVLNLPYPPTANYTWLAATDTNLVSQAVKNIGVIAYPLAGGYRLNINSYSTGAAAEVTICSLETTMGS